MLSLQDILKLRGVHSTKTVRLIRHRDNANDPGRLLNNKRIMESYQKFQSRKVLSDCDLVVSFFGDQGTLSRLAGIYKNNGVIEKKLSTHFPLLPPEVKQLGFTENSSRYFYELEPLPILQDLEERLIISWPRIATSYYMKLDWSKQIEILEIRQSGRRQDFPGYQEVRLSYEELQNLYKHSAAHRDWEQALSNVGGIYLILDTKTGDQYVGQAAGGNGFWQRWSDYAKSGHGDNQRLITLLGSDLTRASSFQFSILAVASKDDQKAIDRLESLFKNKLGSRVHGLNAK